MKVTTRFALEGGREFAANLRALPLAVRKNTLIRILWLAAEPMRAAAASNAPRGAGPAPSHGSASTARIPASVRPSQRSAWARTLTAAAAKQRTGHLADHIAISLARSVGSVEGGRGRSVKVTDYQAAVAVGPEKPYYYGLFLEYGTIKMRRAWPFLRPAFDETAPTSLQIIQREIWAALQASITVAA